MFSETLKTTRGGAYLERKIALFQSVFDEILHSIIEGGKCITYKVSSKVFIR
jgi:hypothetical protein